MNFSILKDKAEQIPRLTLRYRQGNAPFGRGQNAALRHRDVKDGPRFEPFKHSPGRAVCLYLLISFDVVGLILIARRLKQSWVIGARGMWLRRHEHDCSHVLYLVRHEIFTALASVVWLTDRRLFLHFAQNDV